MRSAARKISGTGVSACQRCASIFARATFYNRSPVQLPVPGVVPDLRPALPGISDNVIKLLGKLPIIANDPVERLVLPDPPKRPCSRCICRAVNDFQECRIALSSYPANEGLIVPRGRDTAGRIDQADGEPTHRLQE